MSGKFSTETLQAVFEEIDSSGMADVLETMCDSDNQDLFNKMQQYEEERENIETSFEADL